MKQLLPASRLREARLRRGLTVEAAGFLAGTDPATVSRVERGLQSPTRETIVGLARAYGMSVRRLRALLDDEPPA